MGRPTDRISHHGKHYQFDDVRITPKPVQRPLPAYVASFSKPSIELAARLGCGLIVAPFAAAMSYGGLKQVADLYHETCAKHGKKPRRLMCSYFIHFADNPEQEEAQRARQIRYYKECVIPALPGDPKTAPPSYRYFIDMVERLHKVKPEDLTENSVLLGSSARIIETLKKVEAAGFDEVILYFNVGLKPHQQVKDEMARFMAEVAPAFDGAGESRRGEPNIPVRPDCRSNPGAAGGASANATPPNPPLRRRLRIELGIPIEIVEPAVVQVVRRKQPAVAVQVLHRRLERHLRRPHLRLVRRQVALPQIARRAGGDDVVPGRVAAARARHQVIEGEIVARAAILAAEACRAETR